jgi:hypothetical protein
MSVPSSFKDESGMTLVELIVATTAGLVVFLGLTMMMIVSTHQTTRITERVHATDESRVAIQRVVKEMESACAARYLVPVRPGSTGTKLKFARAYGSAVSPSPVMSEVKLEGTNLVIWEYPVSGGAVPVWTFNETEPTSKRALVSNVSTVSSSEPLFRYYEIKNGVITGPMTVGSSGLTEEQAQKVVKVDFAIKVSPSPTPVTDAGGASIIKDSAYLRFSSPTYLTTSVNGPCE